MNAEVTQIWGEIRQLVLGEGPVVEAVDRATHDAEQEAGCDFSEQREGLIAEMIACRCAAIVQRVEGPMQGAPLFIVLGSWAGMAQQTEQEAVQQALGAMQNFMNTAQQIEDLPTYDPEA